MVGPFSSFDGTFGSGNVYSHVTQTDQLESRYITPKCPLKAWHFLSAPELSFFLLIYWKKYFGY
jgi:hypothetical protein